MATFVYNAISTGGQTVKGKIEADSEGVALARLHEQSFHVLSVAEEKASAFSVGKAKTTGAPKLQSVVVFSRQFATMIDAGLSVLKCMDILEMQVKDPPLKAALSKVKNDIKSGIALGDAMAKHPNCFSKLYINMIRAAEIGGILDTILDRLAGFLEKEMEIRHKIKSAMMYPIIVLCFAIGMVNALFFFILPRFKEIFASMNVEMPVMTQALFGLSDIMVAYWYIILCVPVAAFFAFKRYSVTPAGRMNVDRIKLKLPIIGDLVLKLGVARFSRTFGTLLASGVTMVRAMEIVGETAGNEVLSQAIYETRTAIREGKKLSQPLAESGLFPPMVTHMIDIGEETGRLSEMLVKVADFYDDEVDATVKGLTSLIEPILIVCMGVLVGFIAISIMGPMFKLVSSIA